MDSDPFTLKIADSKCVRIFRASSVVFSQKQMILYFLQCNDLVIFIFLDFLVHQMLFQNALYKI